MNEALLLMSQKGFGCLGIVDGKGHLVGIITDGDLRRHLSGDIFERRVEEVMTPDPKTVGPDALVASALEILNSAAITALLVVEARRPVGLVHMHDLLRLGAA
jgi:arabinose-5-phosphate isomerase